LTVPPLFRETADPHSRREIIKKDLTAGAQNVYLLRCPEKYHRMWWVLGLGGAVGLALVCLVSVSLAPLHAVQDMIGRMIYGLIPSVVQDPVDQLLVHLGLTTLRETVKAIAGILALVGFLAVALYLVSFPVYAAVRAYSLHLDGMLYRKITGQDWTTHWKTEEISEVVSGVAVGRP
jgi:hypothetical protein